MGEGEGAVARSTTTRGCRAVRTALVGKDIAVRVEPTVRVRVVVAGQVRVVGVEATAPVAISSVRVVALQTGTAGVGKRSTGGNLDTRVRGRHFYITYVSILYS
jgi:hypothetical protein